MSVKKIMVILGTSGSGKTTLSKELSNKYNVKEIVSSTTRERRTGEIEGVDYYFVDKINKEDCFEFATHAGNDYGILKSELENDYEKYCVVVNPEGLLHLQKYFSDKPQFELIIVWLLVDKATLIQRLVSRDGENAHKRIDIIEDEFNNIQCVHDTSWIVITNEILQKYDEISDYLIHQY